jgi:CheY-like chemotaxis protein
MDSELHAAYDRIANHSLSKPLIGYVPYSHSIHTEYSDDLSVSQKSDTQSIYSSSSTHSTTLSIESRRPKKILIIEDHPINRKFLHQLLLRKNHYCEEASNGLIGLNMLKATLNMNTDDLYLRDYDVIMMNLMMPIMDGLQSSRAIRSLGYQGPIIGMTSCTYPDEIQDFLEAGATHVLIKPFTIVSVHDILDLY